MYQIKMLRCIIMASLAYTITSVKFQVDDEVKYIGQNFANTFGRIIARYVEVESEFYQAKPTSFREFQLQDTNFDELQIGGEVFDNGQSIGKVVNIRYKYQEEDGRGFRGYGFEDEFSKVEYFDY